MANFRKARHRLVRGRESRGSTHVEQLEHDPPDSIAVDCNIEPDALSSWRSLLWRVRVGGFWLVLCLSISRRCLRISSGDDTVDGCHVCVYSMAVDAAAMPAPAPAPAPAGVIVESERFQGVALRKMNVTSSTLTGETSKVVFLPLRRSTATANSRKDNHDAVVLVTFLPSFLPSFCLSVHRSLQFFRISSPLLSVCTHMPPQPPPPSVTPQ